MPSVPIAGELRQLFEAGAVAAPDRDLLERFQRSGDAGAFAAIVERHGAAVARACRSVLGRPADVDDAFQATFLVLIRRAGAIRDGDRLAHWLVGVARRVALRAKARARRRGDREAGTPAELAELPDRPGLIDPARRELGRLVRAELGQLPRPEQLAVALCDLDGLSHREAADRLGWPLGTVKTRVARGRSRLRARLIRRGLDPALPWLGDALAREAARSAAVARALAGPLARAAGLIASGRAVPAGLLAPGARALADRVARGLLVVPGSLIAATLGVALTAGIVPRGWAGPGDEPSPRTATPPTPAPTHPAPAAMTAPPPGPERSDIETGIPRARRVEVADIDGDGRLDLVVAGERAVRWFRNPSWAARTITGGRDPVIGRVADIAALDVEGDGRAEVALAADADADDSRRGRLVLARSGATARDDWTLRALHDVPGICQVRAGDLDGDGKPELVAAFRAGVATPGRRDPKLAGISSLKLDLAHPRGGVLTTVQVGTWLDFSAIAIRPAVPLPQDPFQEAVIVGPGGVKIEPTGPSPIRGEIEVATPNGLWFLQFTPDRFRVQVSSTDLSGPTRMIPAQPYRAFQRGRFGPGTGDRFVATVAADPHAPLSVWERRRSPELPPTVDAERDPAGAALRVAAVVDRFRDAWTDLGTLTLASSPLDPSRRGGECVAVADLDGDGADEIVAGYAGERRGVVAYRRQGKAWVGTVLDATITPRDLRVGDLDGDGRPDLIALNSEGPGLVWYRTVRPGLAPGSR